MTWRRLMLTLLVAAVLATLLTTRILGQVRLQSGAALDSNLQLGSGGYNSYGRGAVGQRNTARLYRPAYSVSRPRSVQRDYYNTMWADRHYNVARSVGGRGGGNWGYGPGHAGLASPYRRPPPSVIPTPTVPGPGGVTAFRPDMAVHGRFREPCPDCASPVQRIVYADRETNYCATCQTGGRVRADRSLSRLLREDWPRTLDED